MSTPAGWYDDGSGRQRWWDGGQWTDHYAPQGADETAPGEDSAASAGTVAGPGTLGEAAVPPAPAYAPPGSAPVGVAEPKRTPMLGFVGLGLAVLGTILACIPTAVTFWIGAVVLLAAFVVSLVAVFQKGTAKWPSIVGMVLSVVGGIIGVIVLVFTLLTAIANVPVPDLPTAPSSTPLGEQPSDPPATGDSQGRPSVEAIGAGMLIGLKDEGGIDEFKTPEANACIAQALYDSDLSDALLRHVAAGEVITAEIAGDEAEALQSLLADASPACVYE